MIIRVSKDEINIEENSIIHKGEYNVNRLEFTFSEEYNDLIKKAIFEAGKDKIEVMIKNNKCEIPAQILQDKNNSFNLRVYAYSETDNEINIRYSPTYISIPLYEGSYIGDTVQIPTGGGSDVNLQDKTITITENATQTISADAGYDGINTIEITTDVPTSEPNLQDKSETFNANGDYTIYPDMDYDGLSSVNVNVNVSGGANLEYMQDNITSNGTYTYQPDMGYDGISEMYIEVDVPQDVTVQSQKEVTFTSNDIVQVTPDNGYDALESVLVTIDVPSSGSGVDLTNGIKFAYSSMATIPNDILNSNWEDITSGYNMFMGCGQLTTVSEFDTSNLTETSYMFSGCSSLVNFPVLATNNLEFAFDMFENCESLSNQSLDNIMQMFINAPNYTGDKSLKSIGLNETQATTCKTLTHWVDFQSAGWTTGYERVTIEVEDIRNVGAYPIGENSNLDDVYGWSFILTLYDRITSESIEGTVDPMGYYYSNDGTFSCHVNQNWYEDPETGESYNEYDLTDIQSNQ